MNKLKQCTKCLQTKPVECFRTRGEGSSYGKLRYQHCRECERMIDRVTRAAKKRCGVPKSTSCDMCGCTTKRIVFDHDHVTCKFRGWICDSCNRGLSNLGDDLEGVERAKNYLIKTA